MEQIINILENFARNLRKNTHISKFLRIFYQNLFFHKQITPSIPYNESIMTEL